MAGEKRFPASPRKLRRALDAGELPKSKTVTGCCVLSAGLLYEWFSAPKIFKAVSEIFVLSVTRPQDFHTNNVIISAAGAWSTLGTHCVSLCAVCLLTAFGAERAQGGGRFNAAKCLLNFERLNPGDGLRRAFGSTACMEGLIAVFVWMLGLLAAFWAVWHATVGGTMAELERETLARTVVIGLDDLVPRLLFIGWAVALVDLGLVRRRFAKRHAMSLEELREEHKESEGSPEMRGLRRQMHQELTAHSEVQAVRKSKVLVVGYGGTGEHNGVAAGARGKNMHWRK